MSRWLVMLRTSDKSFAPPSASKVSPIPQGQHINKVPAGRIAHDPSIPDHRGLPPLCAGRQLRRGAALNGVQIAELAM